MDGAKQSDGSDTESVELSLFRVRNSHLGRRCRHELSISDDC